MAIAKSRSFKFKRDSSKINMVQKNLFQSKMSDQKENINKHYESQKSLKYNNNLIQINTNRSYGTRDASQRQRDTSLKHNSTTTSSNEVKRRYLEATISSNEK